MKLIRRVASWLMVPALFSGTAQAQTAAPLPDAEPAMWMVRDADTTIYLFGTFHALDGKRDWFNDEIKQAFDASQDVVLEIVTPDNPADMLPSLQKFAFTAPGSPTLTSKLSPRGQQRLAAMLTKSKLPTNALDRYKPFFASVTLATMQFGTMGMGAGAGSEAVIRQAVTAAHKNLGAVETVDQQFALLDALPEKEQIKLLESTLDDESGSMQKEITNMLAAWYRGDARAVAAAIQSSDKDSPALHRIMFTERNAQWVKWIDARLTRPGTVFMAVGAGHLAGNGSVVSLLEREGRKVTRIQ